MCSSNNISFSRVIFHLTNYGRKAKGKCIPTHSVGQVDEPMSSCFSLKGNLDECHSNPFALRDSWIIAQVVLNHFDVSLSGCEPKLLDSCWHDKIWQLVFFNQGTAFYMQPRTRTSPLLEFAIRSFAEILVDRSERYAAGWAVAARQW